MAEEREVKIRIGVEAPKGDGFKKLAEDATKTGKTVEQKIKEMQDRADGFGNKTKASFAKAGQGATEFGRGLMLLAGSGGGMEKLIKQMAVFQGTIDIFRGATSAVMGLTNAFGHLDKAVVASRAAQALGGGGAAGGAKGGKGGGGIGNFLAGLGIGGVGIGVGGVTAAAGVLAAATGAAAVSTTIPGVSDWYAKQLSGSTVGDMLKINAGTDIGKIENRFKFFDNPESNPDLSGEELNELQAARHTKMLMRKRLHNIGRQYGGQGPEAEAAYAREAAIRDPIEARQRTLRNMGEQVGLGLSLFGHENRRFREGQESEARFAAFGESRADALRADAAPGAFARLAWEGRGLANAEVAGPHGTAASAGAIASAELERVQALRHIAALQKEIARAAKDQKTTLTETTSLQHQMAEAQQKLAEAETKRTAATMAGAAAERDRLANVLKWATEQERAMKAIVQAEKDRLTGHKEQFGFMDPEKKLEALRISRKVKAGGELTREDAEMVGGMGVFGDEVRRQSLRNADRDPMTREIFANMGAEARVRDAQNAQKQFADLKISLAQKVEATIKINEESLAQQFKDKVIPEINLAIAAMGAQIADLIRKGKMEEAFQQGAGSGGGF